MRKFCLLCDTTGDQRSSTRRLHDVDTCANDLRLEMAHLSQCGMSVLMNVKLRTTENKRACALNCALTSTSPLTTQVWIEWLVSHKLMPQTPRFPESKVPDTVSDNESICPPLRSLPQSVGTGISTSCSSRSGFQTYCIYQIPATVASSVHISQPRCNSHGFTPWIRTTLNEGFSCLLQKVIKQSDSPCLSDQRVACVVNSLIPLVRSRRARSQTTSVSE